MILFGYNFPSEISVIPSVPSQVYRFDNCSFHDGLTEIPPLFHQCFFSCHFHSNAVVRFNRCYSIHFTGCRFDNGARIICETSATIELEGCELSPQPIFTEKVRAVEITRVTPRETLCYLPDCMILIVRDGHTPGINWELDEPIKGLPLHGPVISYHNQVAWKTPKSLDVLVLTLLRNSKLTFCRIQHDDGDMKEYFKVYKHSNRREVSCILTLLHVIPAELVRGELACYLI